MTDALRHPPSNYINGSFLPLPGDAIRSHDPAMPDRIIWEGTPVDGHLNLAIEAARNAFESWSATSLDDRIAILRRWQEVTTKHAPRIARLITDEMGKILSESMFEAKALAGKVDITLGDVSMNRVAEYEVTVSDSRSGRCRFKPHGVMAVIGPFNFPAHLPNGQFVPALLMGNTVVLKPSEKTPAVGQLLAELMDEAGIPPGVFNVVQGAGDIAAQLVNHDDIAGVLFTGSWEVGRKILRANLDRPGRIIALELGGNNPAVVMDDAPLKLAVLECLRASFATTGQRCTCTRRIIVHEALYDRFLSAYCKAASTLLIGPGASEQPVFMGPLVTGEACDAVLGFQSELADSGGGGPGGRVLVEATMMDGPGHFITPGVMEVDGFTLDRDCEVFGPFVQICTVQNLDEAIEQANATRYGLAASIFTSDERTFETFFRRINAGCINFNNGTAGASGKLPFGGWGRSGNHRPAAAFATDFSVYPVANMIETADDLPVPTGVQWKNEWIS
ncbi:MAG: aldehyde dehydrogenase family protein [Planctomycetes bacterium]|nr:aldehyde dehydrogenase family protein [Planctomycetota bacterium]